MPIQPNMTQRDLVKLALLVCGERTGAKYRPPAKATHSPVAVASWSGYSR